MNDGGMSIRLHFVADVAARTFSGVGFTGGFVGLKMLAIIPVDVWGLKHQFHCKDATRRYLTGHAIAYVIPIMSIPSYTSL